MLSEKTVGTTSLRLSTFGLGATGLAGMYTQVPRTQAMDTLAMAWEKGVRYFDTAPFYGYGLGERRMGDFLRTKPRDSFVLSTKVGRMLAPLHPPPENNRFYRSELPFELKFDYSYDGAMRSIEDSLQRLGLGKIDIALIHDIDRFAHQDAQAAIFKQAMEGAYKALHQLRSEGLIDAIGIGVNECEVCVAALEHGDFDCFLLAGRFTLLDQSALATLLPKCAQRKVSIINGGVFNSGLLANLQAAELKYDYGHAPEEKIAKAKKIDAVCKKYEVPLAAAALQFPLWHPAVCTILLGARSAKEVSEIMDWLTIKIPVDLWEEFFALGLTDEK